MKRGKEEEKIMGPMFPRLHVNDTDKGGPRAPPRNKMALYEQVTIPSQRYNSGVAPPKQNNRNMAPSTSTSQGTNRERNAYFPIHQPPSTPTYDAIQVFNAEASNSNNQLGHVESKKKPLEDDDFMVPIFSEAGTEMHNDITQNNINGEGQIYLSSNHHVLCATTVGDETSQIKNGDFVSNHQTNRLDGRTLSVFASSRSSLDISMSRRDDLPCQNDTLLDEDVPDLQKENPLTYTSLSLSLIPQTRRDEGDEMNSGIHRLDDDQYLEKENIDRGDDVSETSMVDSASEFDISPDDVVDIIGRKQFWKARTAIVNQQRVFAVQVFELHRLLKVQKLIAGSPNLLLEASAFVGKSSEFLVKALPHKAIPKDATHRANDKVEGTAENAVPKAPTSTPAPVPAPAAVPPRQHPIQPAGYPSFSSNTALSPPGNTDPKINPWGGFHQPSAHQWLVPVMTPSEGLVYKPYPAPGFMGPVCGGCGPVGPTPMVGNFMTPQYHQGVGMPPGIHFGGPGFFPPYGMPMMSSGLSGSTVDHLNPLSGPNPNAQTGQPEGPCLKPQASKQGELHGSTASSPSGRPHRIGMVPVSEGRDANPTTEVPMDTPPREKQARVIRAVPHRSTSDSAARIFQSIQQERQLYESR